MMHTFVAYVEDLPGVLTRVASLFRRLNINIHSLTVGRSERAGLSRMTVVCEASAEAGHRIQASLYKLENVVDVDDIAQAPSVTRELALIKVAATPRSRSMRLAARCSAGPWSSPPAISRGRHKSSGPSCASCSTSSPHRTVMGPRNPVPGG